MHDGDGVTGRKLGAPLRPEGTYAAAIYGSILATGLVASLRYTTDAGSLALTLISTSGVFWLAHVWSAVLGERIESRKATGPERIKRLAAEEWPMVEAGVLPFVALGIARIGLYPDRVGIDVALGVAIAQLVGWGFLGARQMGAGWAKGILVGVADGLLGLAIVGLEVLLH